MRFLMWIIFSITSAHRCTNCYIGPEVPNDISYPPCPCECVHESTCAPTLMPTAVPTLMPTNKPSLTPTRTPSAVPTNIPTGVPTSTPTKTPTCSCGLLFFVETSKLKPLLTNFFFFLCSLLFPKFRNVDPWQLFCN